MRRVVITGLGAVSCLGNSKEEIVDSLKNGRSGIVANESYKEMGLRSQISGSVNIDKSEHIDRKVLRFMGDAAAYSYIAMQKAIDETGRRRERQLAHNKAHDITPASIVKQVSDIMESAYPTPKRGRFKASEGAVDYEAMSPEQLMKQAAKLEKKMLKHARDLEFEEAARLRDEIRHVREMGLGVADRKAG